MIIQLDKELRIADLEDEFSIFYPYLKIQLQAVDLKRNKHKDDKIEITGSETVKQLQHHLLQHLAMKATLFRKQHDQWVELTSSNELTLKEQNELGRAEAEHEEETRLQDFFETEF